MSQKSEKLLRLRAVWQIVSPPIGYRTRGRVSRGYLVLLYSAAAKIPSTSRMKGPPSKAPVRPENWRGICKAAD